MLFRFLKCVLVTVFLSSSSFGCAEIVEVEEMATIHKYVTQDSLILVNVTGTLYQPVNTCADKRWRDYFAERVNVLISDPAVANRVINQVKNEIVCEIPKKLVEEDTPRLIAQWQSQEIPVLGITQKYVSTSFAENFGFITKQHLLSLGIDLERTLSYFPIENESDENSSFAYGMIFTCKQPVGPAILTFFNRLENKPARIIMIDDSLENLANAEAILRSADRKFVGLRYGHADLLKTNFDPILGNIQFFVFMKEGRIISDDEAYQIQQASPEVNYVKLLDVFIESQKS